MSSAVAAMGVWASGTPSENSYGPAPAGAAMSFEFGREDLAEDAVDLGAVGSM